MITARVTMMAPDGKGKTQDTAVPHTLSALDDAPCGGDALMDATVRANPGLAA
jgi:hypothetical protein